MTIARKSIVFGIIACIIVLASIGGACYAYFTRVDTHTHNSNTASMATELYSVTKGSTYTIGTKYTGPISATASSTKSFAVRNTSDIPVYLRMSYVVGVANAAIITPVDSANYTATIYSDPLYVSYSGGSNTFEGWTLVENGYYYYNSAIAPGEYIPFGQIASESTMTSNAVIKLAVEVIQCTDAVRNVWNPNISWQTSSFIHLDTKYSVDGVDLSPYWGNNMTGKELVPILPNGNGWHTTAPLGESEEFNNSNSLMVPLSKDVTSVDIANLTGTNNNSYLRIYNASRKLMMINATYNMILMTSTDGVTWSDATALWATGNYFEDLSITINFKDSDNWVDVRETTGKTFTNSTGSVSYVYNQLVLPGESINALSSPVTIAGVNGLLDNENKYNGRYYAFRISVSISGVESAVVGGVDLVQKALDYSADATGFFRDQVDNHSANSTTLSTLQADLTTQYTYWLTKVDLLDDQIDSQSNDDSGSGAVI